MNLVWPVVLLVVVLVVFVIAERADDRSNGVEPARWPALRSIGRALFPVCDCGHRVVAHSGRAGVGCMAGTCQCRSATVTD
jgi:hypothetical protein